MRGYTDTFCLLGRLQEKKKEEGKNVQVLFPPPTTSEYCFKMYMCPYMRPYASLVCVCVCVRVCVCVGVCVYPKMRDMTETSHF